MPFKSGDNTYTWSINATLDALTGEITISSNQSSGFTGATVVFLHWNGSAYEVITEIKATYTGKAIVFDQDDAMGLQAEGGGWYTRFDMISMTKIIDDPNADPNEGWTSLGNAELYDPWVLTGLGLDNSVGYAVELQQSDADENVYRLVDPYKGESPAAAYNESTAAHGYIQFNVSDPDHVCFDAVEAGFANSELGVTKFYCYNVLGLYVSMGYSADLVIRVLGDQIPYTVFKDGVVTLSSIETTDDKGNPETDYDAVFGIQSNKNAGYGWTNSADEAIPMLGKIVFPGAGADLIEADEADAPVKYYNLQGVAVSTPAAGQFVIRVKGDKATKMVIR